MTFEFVVGFAFHANQVLLMEKKRPSWQAGRLNGVGGHIENGESILDAMVREFKEETGVNIGHNRWTHFSDLCGEGFVVYFLSCEMELIEALAAEQTTDEALVWVGVTDLVPEKVIPNLTWMIPMARHLPKELHSKPSRLKINEVY